MDMRLFIVLIIPFGVSIYAFHHENINGFVYRVLGQTPLGMSGRHRIVTILYCLPNIKNV